MEINLQNYRAGLIEGYELAYQDKDWYKKNKDNFCNSLKTKFPSLVPSYISNNKNVKNIKNYLGFMPDDMIRFGELELAEMEVEGINVEFWVVRIPPGFNLYHSSRALGLNHADFPMIGYENNAKKEDNLTSSQTICPTNKFIGESEEDVKEGKVCTYVTYYSTPYLTKGYLRRDKGYGGDAIKYAYGIGLLERDEYQNKLYNDRLRVEINPQTKTVTEQTEGIAAYITNKDTYYFVFGLDDILIDRPSLGRQNMYNFYNLFYLLSDVFMKKLGFDYSAYRNFLSLVKSVSGIGTLEDNVKNIMKDYPGATNFQEGLKRWVVKSARYFENNKLNTAGRIKEFPTSLKNYDPEKIRGLRFSTYEHDRPVMNMISWLFSNYKTSLRETKGEIKVGGFISSSMYVFSKGKGDVTKGNMFNIGDLTFYAAKGYFHSEIGLFFAPDTLERNRNNKYDTEYSINYLGIQQEYRKFKTTNILEKDKHFHQGHLLEHNTWVGLIASKLYTEVNDVLNSDISKEYPIIRTEEVVGNSDIYFLAGYFHDLGKSGKCEKEAVYRNLDVQDARMSVCEYVSSSGEASIVGMRYHELPAHPEDGYAFMKGYNAYKKFTLNGRDNVDEFNKKAQKLYFEDWEKFFTHIGVDSFHKRLIRIAAGAHWYFGNYLRIISQKKDSTQDPAFVKGLAMEYLRKIETFFNDEFYELDKEVFKQVLIFTVIVSISDILGSEYAIDRSYDFKGEQIVNYLPNIPLSNLSEEDLKNPEKIIPQIIRTALENARLNKNKRKIIDNVLNLSEFFLKACIMELENFTFKPDNNYAFLYNLKNAYPSTVDVYTAFPNHFPKAICFDLDQTLFAAKFSREGVNYVIYEDVPKIIEECQKLRQKGVKICLTSRHYAPKTLRQLLQDKESPLYYANFDLIVSRYTGSLSKIKEDVSKYPDFFENNGTVEDGFIMDNTGDYYNIPNNSKFLDLNKVSKAGHFNLVKRKFNLEYSQILEFDDDEKYFKREGCKECKVVGLGEAQDVFIAGVLKSHKVADQGIRYSLFKDAIAFYVFDNFNR